MSLYSTPFPSANSRVNPDLRALEPPVPPRIGARSDTRTRLSAISEEKPRMELDQQSEFVDSLGGRGIETSGPDGEADAVECAEGDDQGAGGPAQEFYPASLSAYLPKVDRLYVGHYKNGKYPDLELPAYALYSRIGSLVVRVCKEDVAPFVQNEQAHFFLEDGQVEWKDNLVHFDLAIFGLHIDVLKLGRKEVQEELKERIRELLAIQGIENDKSLGHNEAKAIDAARKVEVRGVPIGHLRDHPGESLIRAHTSDDKTLELRLYWDDISPKALEILYKIGDDKEFTVIPPNNEIILFDFVVGQGGTQNSSLQKEISIRSYLESPLARLDYKHAPYIPTRSNVLPASLNDTPDRLSLKYDILVGSYKELPELNIYCYGKWDVVQYDKLLRICFRYHVDDLPHHLKSVNPGFFKQRARLRAVFFDEVVFLPEYNKGDQTATKEYLKTVLVSPYAPINGQAVRRYGRTHKRTFSDFSDIDGNAPANMKGHGQSRDRIVLPLPSRVEKADLELQSKRRSSTYHERKHRSTGPASKQSKIVKLALPSIKAHLLALKQKDDVIEDLRLQIEKLRRGNSIPGEASRPQRSIFKFRSRQVDANDGASGIRQADNDGPPSVKEDQQQPVAKPRLQKRTIAGIQYTLLTEGSNEGKYQQSRPTRLDLAGRVFDEWLVLAEVQIDLQLVGDEETVNLDGVDYRQITEGRRAGFLVEVVDGTGSGSLVSEGGALFVRWALRKEVEDLLL